jgi:uncharacterized protein (UPF0332 family)
MTPLAFLDLANRLVIDSRDPASVRTATSRAYYAAFHSVRTVMFSSWRQPELIGGNEHRLLQQCLINSDVPEACAIGKLLENLHDHRKSADYDLLDADFDSPQNAEVCIERATDIIAKLNACEAGVLGAQIRAGITQYRRLRQV